MNETHCFELLVEIAAGLKMLNSTAQRRDTTFCLDGVQCLLTYKDQDYVLSLRPKGEKHEPIRPVTPSVAA